MAISERNIKLLWGRAAGRCSICKILLTEDKEKVTGAFPFGEHAHIVAEKPDGPRGDERLAECLRDNYQNLILLCPTCHTKVDQAPEDYPIERLRLLKQGHESEMALVHPRDKDSYDESLQFSRVTEKNWLAPDRENYIPIGVTKEEWIAPFLNTELDPAVPKRVISAFEVARASMIYSWFFYPLATLGLEQLMRVGRLAVRERCHMIPCEPKEGFVAELTALAEAKVISGEDKSRWEALGRLCDDPAFLAGATLFDPGQAISTLHLIADLINGLFVKQVAP